MRGKNNWIRSIALGLVLAMSLSTSAITAMADETGGGTTTSPEPAAQQAAQTVTFKLHNSDGTEKTFSFTLKDGETYGPGLSDTVSVRDTYFDKETRKDYDLQEAVPASGSKGTATFNYVEHTDSVLTYKLYCVDENGAILETIPITLEPNTAKTIEVPEELTIGNTVYTTDEKSVSVDYNNKSLSRSVVYKVKDTAGAYPVTVNYVDEDDKLLATRTFTVNDKQVVFSAPTVFAVTEGNKTVYYQIKDEKDAVITHNPDDSTRTYTIQYVNAANVGASYSWYIMQYDASDNKCLGVIKKEVKKGKTVTFDPSTDNTINGYTVNGNFEDKLSHTYGDANHVSYVYYDPEGYHNTTDVPDKTVTVNYVDIATKSILKTAQVNLNKTEDTLISFDDSFDLNGIHYVRVDGQLASTEHNYYSPRTTYTVYYRDINNTDFEHVVIHTEEVLETVVTEGTTRTIVNPIVRRVTVVNTETGETETIAVEDAAGNTIQTNGTASSNSSNNNGINNNNATASNDNGNSSDNSNSDNGTDNVIDGIKAEDIDTPQGNINLKGSQAKDNSRVILYSGLAAGIALVFFIILFYKRKHKKAEEK
ncbi:MAG: hypothetical protein LKE64_08660 [Solobacterium sp.]|jgi:hypothetical protein|nr:hypothetical protein [Solobacterium sp.]MCH4048703.1 hypothetical protein [Solobacterium sp.]MCH4075606.1 hypothetical protein [Solobacterium sp.]